MIEMIAHRVSQVWVIGVIVPSQALQARMIDVIDVVDYKCSVIEMIDYNKSSNLTIDNV